MIQLYALTSCYRQEVAALSTVDTHVRERLSMLRQQQEDMAVLLSQISAVCYQCEKTLQHDDAKVLTSQQEVKQLLNTVQTQQQHFSELPEQLHLDPTIPITFTKVLTAHHPYHLPQGTVSPRLTPRC